MTQTLKLWVPFWLVTMAGAAVMTSFAIEPLAVGAQCDGKAIPCPLQQWERVNSGTPFASGDLAKVAKSMEQLRKFGGPNMTRWDVFARKAADDAKANKTDDLKADCKTCHDAYKDAYIKDTALRNKAVP
jgi:hypothetical protein